PALIVLVWRLHHPQKTNLPNFHDRENWGGFHRERNWAARWAVVIVAGWVAVSLVLTAWLPYRHEQSRWGPPIVQKLTFQKWSGSVRLAQYRETWRLLRDHPIRGAGPAGYQTAIAPYHEKKDVEIFLYPHNLLLAIWVELGLAGLLLFLAILYQLFRQAFVIRHSSFVIPALLVILMHGLVDVPYFKNDLAMLFWVIAALGTVPLAFDTMGTHDQRLAGNLPPSTPNNR
ncbi:O-antigen ligase family protein, partial [Candidatus Uhrbacteria bacterium]|nr:O-antigen ligase family protein [Candidatus Uhrbacteria bacterium]